MSEIRVSVRVMELMVRVSEKGLYPKSNPNSTLFLTNLLMYVGVWQKLQNSEQILNSLNARTRIIYRLQIHLTSGFGFRANSSCEQALLKSLDGWIEAVDKGNVVGALLI